MGVSAADALDAADADADGRTTLPPRLPQVAVNEFQVPAWRGVPFSCRAAACVGVDVSPTAAVPALAVTALLPALKLLVVAGLAQPACVGRVTSGDGLVQYVAATFVPQWHRFRVAAISRCLDMHDSSDRVRAAHMETAAVHFQRAVRLDLASTTAAVTTISSTGLAVGTDVPVGREPAATTRS